uniref:Uncharacterized protein n=1 Tax=Ditylenchus dipsaci TaxID=166011 RepID=A0A915CQ76_9BILA
MRDAVWQNFSEINDGRRQAQNPGCSAEPTDRYKKIHAALSAVLSIPSILMNIILHLLMRRLFHVMSPNFEVTVGRASSCFK